MGLSASAPFAVAAAERGEPFPCAVELPGDHRLDVVVRRGGRGLAQWLSDAVAQWLSGSVAQCDWAGWHRDYDDSGSLLSRRLELVRGTYALSSIMPPPETYV
jgi:hypothetical protein